MAGGSLLALLDDIATVLDDVALLTKVAAKKTAGVLGDDLALNAEQVSGVRAEREIPVVWAVAKGSFLNKLILVPMALLISVIAPWLISPLLMVGGLYLCFEGFEKIAHKFLHNSTADQKQRAEIIAAISDPNIDMVAFEKNKIKGAIRTDFVLSAEIIVIALGTVKDANFMMQAGVVSGIAIIMTMGVYGLVAGIVKLDDLGYYLLTKRPKKALGRLRKIIGNSLLVFSPWLMKALMVVGTAAMFLVGGGILLHGIPMLTDYVHDAESIVQQIRLVGGLLGPITPLLLNAFFGLLAGAISVLIYKPASAIFEKFKR